MIKNIGMFLVLVFSHYIVEGMDSSSAKLDEAKVRTVVLQAENFLLKNFGTKYTIAYEPSLKSAIENLSLPCFSEKSLKSVIQIHKNHPDQTVQSAFLMTSELKEIIGKKTEKEEILECLKTELATAECNRLYLVFTELVYSRASTLNWTDDLKGLLDRSIRQAIAVMRKQYFFFCPDEKELDHYFQEIMQNGKNKICPVKEELGQEDYLERLMRESVESKKQQKNKKKGKKEY